MGNAIRRRRAEVDVSQEVAGAGAEMEQSQWGRYERGERFPDWSTLVRIAGALEIKVGALLTSARLIEEPKSFAEWAGGDPSLSAETRDLLMRVYDWCQNQPVLTPQVKRGRPRKKGL